MFFFSYYTMKTFFRIFWNFYVHIQQYFRREIQALFILVNILQVIKNFIIELIIIKLI